MTRVKIEYDDHNENLSMQLPQCGDIVGRYSSTTGVDDWFLVKLDNSIRYDMSNFKAVKIGFIDTNYVLIRSRWAGGIVGGRMPTSVFLLLVDHSMLPLENPLVIDRYPHISWCMSTTLDEIA